MNRDLPCLSAVRCRLVSVAGPTVLTLTHGAGCRWVRAAAADPFGAEALPRHLLGEEGGQRTARKQAQVER